jgi:two-component system CheB/CheR fusion protein
MPLAPESKIRRILVVDDNVDSAETMAEILKLWGHEVQTAHDGPGALEAARAHPPDAVLLDLGLPVMDGYETARRLREEGLGRLLVAVTGFGAAEDRRRTAEAGFDTHLTKPVSPEALRRVLRAPESEGP